jgi:hypothetical protein
MISVGNVYKSNYYHWVLGYYIFTYFQFDKKIISLNREFSRCSSFQE